MSNSGGKISRPVRQIADIRTVLGVTSGGIGALCTSNKVSPKSFHKPMQHSSVLALTEAQRRSNDWGWGAMQGNIGTQLYQVLNAKGAGQTWSHVKPTARYRHHDFDDYDHASPDPFATSTDQSSYRTDQTARLSFGNFDELKSHLAEWGAFAGVSTVNMGIGVAFATSATKTNWTSSDSWYLLVGNNGTVQSWNDMDNERIPFIKPAALEELGQGVWYIYPFIVKDTRGITASSTGRVSGMTRTDCVMFYGSPMKMTIAAIDPFAGLSFAITGSCTGNPLYERISGITVNLGITTGAAMEALTQIRGDIYIDHCGTMAGQDISVQIGTTMYWYNPTRGTVYTMTATREGNLYLLNYDPSGEGKVPVRAVVTTVLSGSAETKNVTGNILINEPMVTVVLKNTTGVAISVAITGDLTETVSIAAGSSVTRSLPKGSSIAYTATASGYNTKTGSLTNIQSYTEESISLVPVTAYTNVTVNIVFNDGQMFHNEVVFRWRQTGSWVSQNMVSGNNTVHDVAVGQTMYWEAYYENVLKASGNIMVAELTPPIRIVIQ